MIGCDCEVCRSIDPRDKRLRTSIFIQTPTTCLLVDSPPDLRTQCLREGITRADAVIFTHSHTDHTSGFDDLRRFCEGNGGSLPVYASLGVMADLQVRFGFAFGGNSHAPNYLNAVSHIFRGPFEIGDIQITPVSLPHGRSDTSGFVFSWQGSKRLAYFTDCSAVPETASEAATGAQVLVLDTLRWRSHPTHLSVDEALVIAKRIATKRTFLTHLSHELGHVSTEEKLPNDVRLAYDGLRLAL